MRPPGGAALVLLALTALAASSAGDLPRVVGLPGIPRGTPSDLTAPPWFPRLPDLGLVGLDGSPLPLAPAPGKVILLDFWASWCAPCREELPLLERLWHRQRARGLEAWAVNVGETEEIAGRFARELGLELPVALDRGTAGARMAVRSLPVVMLVDGEGRIRQRWDGYREGIDREIEVRTRALLGGDAEARPQALGRVESGPALRGRWLREVPGEAGGVAIVPGDGGAPRLVVRRAGRITAFGPDGAPQAEGKAPVSSGRLVRAEDLLLGWRPGSSELVVFDPQRGSHRVVGLPSPLAALDASPEGVLAGGPEGAWFVDPVAGTASPLGDLRGVRAVVWAGPRRGVLDGSGAVRWFGPDGTECGRTPVPVGTRGLLALDPGCVLAVDDEVVGSARGRVIADAGEVVLATARGRLLVLDPSAETVRLAAHLDRLAGIDVGDLDADGLDELVLAAGRRIAVLTSR